MNTPQKFLVVLLLVFLALFSQTDSAAAPSPQKPQPGLFTEVAGVSNLDTANDPTVIRSKPVTIDFNQLAGSATQGVGIASTPEVNDVVQLNLFDDASYTAILGEIQPASNGGYLWIGHLEDIPFSQVIFAVNAGQTAGSIAEPDGFYGIRYVSGDVHAVLQIDQSAFPDDTPIPVTYPEDPAPIQVAADNGSQLDVLAVYTGAARQAAGGITAIENLINLALTETNQSYANSGVNPRLRLVHMEEVSYAESGDMSTDLSRLQNSSDSFMDNVHTLRNTHAADLVSLIVEGGSYCGIAYVMTNVSSAFEDDAFSVTARNCATGYYSFGHEIGHNMGARHDWYVDPTSNSPYTYNHGYSNLTDRWRTVMAYNTQCSDSGFNCTRLPYWSNPNVTYGGDPMGIPEGSFQAADNRKALNNSAYTVANFRDSGGTSPAAGPLVYSSHSVDDNTVGQSSGNNNGIAECGEAIELFVWLRNQGATTAENVAATLSTTSPYVNFSDNLTTYGNIGSGFTLASLDDFDFSISAGTPNGHIIQFNLNITADNGGPWSDSFNIPVTCGTGGGDSFEPDNSSAQAKTIISGLSQTHSIYPVADQDWVTFTLPNNSAVTIETSGLSTSDTRMWLYNNTLTQLAYNDDINLQDGNLFSRIDFTCDGTPLSAGTYFVKIDEYGNNNIINAYTLSLTVTPCVDIYEPDNTPGQAKWLFSGSPHQKNIKPVGDEDWVKFTTNTTSTVTLETSGPSGDTRMWLYDENDLVNYLEYNDDGGVVLFSRIDRLCDVEPLLAGTYYVKVDEFWGTNEIESYNLSLQLMSCDPELIFLPIVVK